MNDGGPAYPCGVEADYYGMSLREAFAVALAGYAAPDIRPNEDRVSWARNVFCVAQILTDEAVRRREKDNAEQAEQVVKGEHDHRMGWGDRT
jgi:hypothetical protein